MQLHRPFGAPKHRPGKHVRTQIDDGGIQTEQLVLESERLRAGDLATPRQHLVEHDLIERPGAVGIGVGERRPRRRRDPEMRELALAARQPAADLAQRMRPPELREQHRHELVPAGEPAGMPLGVRLLHGALKVDARK